MKRRHIIPLEMSAADVRKLRREADERRRALRQAKLTTYVIGLRGGAAGIVCLCCGLGSSNATDIEERYCGFCKRLHDDDMEKEE